MAEQPATKWHSPQTLNSLSSRGHAPPHMQANHPMTKRLQLQYRPQGAAQLLRSQDARLHDNLNRL
jgi:hypothetical protein